MESHLCQQVTEDERGHPEDRATAGAQCSLEVFGARQGDLGLPAIQLLVAGDSSASIIDAVVSP